MLTLLSRNEFLLSLCQTVQTVDSTLLKPWFVVLPYWIISSAPAQQNSNTMSFTKTVIVAGLL